MIRWFSILIFFIFSIAVQAGPAVFQGRVDLGRDLASLEQNPPVPGTLYLLTGAAAAVRIVSEEPFVAEVDFVQGEWKSESDLVAHRTLLRFEGAEWAKTLVAKKPRQNTDLVIYPYRKFQVAAVLQGNALRVVAVPLLF